MMRGWDEIVTSQLLPCFRLNHRTRIFCRTGDLEILTHKRNTTEIQGKIAIGWCSEFDKAEFLIKKKRSTEKNLGNKTKKRQGRTRKERNENNEREKRE